MKELADRLIARGFTSSHYGGHASCVCAEGDAGLDRFMSSTCDDGESVFAAWDVWFVVQQVITDDGREQMSGVSCAVSVLKVVTVCL